MRTPLLGALAALLLAPLAGCEPVAGDPSERNLAAMNRVYEAFNTGNTAILDSVITPDFIEHENIGSPGSGPEPLKQFIMGMRTAFPDLHFTVDDLFAAGDRVVSFVTIRGTNGGEFMGRPATNRPIEVTGIDVVRFEDGMAVEHWGSTDDLGMMQQLGLVPTPEAPADSTAAL